MAQGNRGGAEVSRENDQVLTYLRSGLAQTETEATRKLGIKYGSWAARKRRSPELRRGTEEAIAEARLLPPPRSAVPDFETFRRECFGHDTPAHQKEWITGIENHDSTMILCPPAHGKSSVMEEYIVWRIVKDPNVRCIIVSKGQTAAKKRLRRVKDLLSNEHLYDSKGLRNVVKEWGPFKGDTWSATHFYVVGVDSGERDPTVEALGVGSQIQGARADIIFLDDIGDRKNQRSEDLKNEQWRWIGAEVISRLGLDSRFVIIATRVDETDIYARLLESPKLDVEGEERSFHTIVQPAIIKDEDEAGPAEVLWPEVWSYDRLAAKRENPFMEARIWALVYQQSSDGIPDAVFPNELLESCHDFSYTVGSVLPFVHVMGIDPALTGTIAMVVLGVNIDTGHRFVVDVVAEEDTHDPSATKDLCYEVARKYGVRACWVEKNASQGWFSRDYGPGGLGSRLQSIGCTFVEEFTSQHNKYNPEWGVASIASQMRAGLYSIPWDQLSSVRLRTFVDELKSWRPVGTRRLKQDRVMAMWLAELAAVDMIRKGTGPAPPPRRMSKAVRHYYKNAGLGTTRKVSRVAQRSRRSP